MNMSDGIKKEILNPPNWKKPRGYSNMVKTIGGTTLYLAGQASFDSAGNLVGEGDFCKQYEQTLKNIQEVLETGGGKLTDIVRMTFYCTDRDAYFSSAKECGQIYRKYFENYYPAMTLIEVTKLFQDGMLLEIEAIAVF
jgi:enamine deaminase RidA (YjgF/YER057c/UK114 family)